MHGVFLKVLKLMPICTGLTDVTHANSEGQSGLHHSVNQQNPRQAHDNQGDDERHPKGSTATKTIMNEVNE